VYRVTYIYNVRDDSEVGTDGDAQRDRARRIRRMPRQPRLASLDDPPRRDAT
jgi:hypothetical protein